MAIYLFMNVGTFAVILCMRQHGPHGRGDQPTSPAWRAPSRAWPLALAIFMFSMAGIPPLAGFFGKLLRLPGRDRRQSSIALAVIGVRRQRRRRLLLPAHRQGDVFRRAGVTPSTGRWTRPLAVVMLGASAFTLLFFSARRRSSRGASAAAAALFAG